MRIIGHFGQMTDRGVYGWAMETSSLEPVDVYLYANGKLAATGKADQYREGLLKNGFHPTGYGGFQFKFEEMTLREAPNYKFEVKAGKNQEKLGNEIYAVGRNTGDQDQIPPPVMFIHVQKTAGTSFRNMLFHLFPEEVIYANKSVMKRFKGRYPSYLHYLSQARETAVPTKLWVGHTPFVTGKYLSPEMTYLTFLREPVARAISHLTYLHRTHAEYRHMSLEDCFGSIKRQQLWNLQTRFFADTDINKLNYYGGKKTMDDEGLAIAKQQLAQCDFVGIVEDFDQSIKQLEKKLNWKFDALHRDNVSKKQQQLPIHILQEIEANVRYDVKLYEFALQLFSSPQKKV